MISWWLTSEDIGQRCTVAEFLKTLAILLPTQGLVKSVLQPTYPANADQDNPNIPAMESESMSTPNHPRVRKINGRVLRISKKELPQPTEIVVLSWNAR